MLVPLLPFLTLSQLNPNIWKPGTLTFQLESLSVGNISHSTGQEKLCVKRQIPATSPHPPPTREGRMIPEQSIEHTKIHDLQIWHGPPNSYLPNPSSSLTSFGWAALLGEEKESLAKVWRWLALLSSSPHSSANFPLLQFLQAPPEGCPLLTASRGTFNQPRLCSQQDQSNCVRGCQGVPPCV